MSRSNSPLEDGVEENAPPSLESEIQEERIAARRLRIAARVQARKRETEGQHDTHHQEVTKELSRSQKQREQSRRRLNKLQSDGTELVTNIQVAVDARESQRRTEEAEAKRQRTEKLENEAKTSLEKFEDIRKKWASAKAKEIPQDLRDALNMQQRHCAQLIEEKSKIINELQQELKVQDDKYVKDLKRQAEDVDLMIERMEEQIKNLMKCYREELTQIEKAFELERRELLHSNYKKWEQTMQHRREKEMEYLTMRMKQVEDQAQQLQQLRVQDAEEYNMIKIKLETDVQILEQQLQHMKATFQLNQEKLEYNFQVLKKRDEENTITKSQQKRRITRLQDVLNNLRIKLKKQEKQFKEESHTLSEDCKRIMKQYQDMQKKMMYFASIDAKRFHEMWIMNEEEIKGLVKKALDANLIIHEQQLGMTYVRPNLPFMKSTGPIIPQHTKKKLTEVLAKQFLTAGQKITGDEEGVEESVSAGAQGESHQSKEQGQLEASYPENPDNLLPQISPKTMKKLLEIMCDECDFLVESKLLKLFSTLEKHEQSLMKLDSIFMALGVENEADVYKLADFLIKYSEQQIAENKKEDEEDGQIDEGKSQSYVSISSVEAAEGSSSMIERSTTTDLIHPNDVLKALKVYTEHYCKPREKHPLPSFINYEERDDSEDAAFWEAMANVIPESTQRVWSALETELEKYYKILTERSDLITETEGLKQQNTELRMLLHQYINSRVNAELEIPPTQVMQIDQR
ncbi:dynein regulatory complex protein 1 isoform X1 [Polypterus senegalus]|uniref:dynein regulatory complex protein 1 isoform X1 n=1 Tax=Polypterus senegalus TaxID=55291 RepID=UPI001964A86C|nr:dynein regulatory complex protein 1 isoform X1 [Polypterus senegalus]